MGQNILMVILYIISSTIYDKKTILPEIKMISGKIVRLELSCLNHTKTGLKYGRQEFLPLSAYSITAAKPPLRTMLTMNVESWFIFETWRRKSIACRAALGPSIKAVNV